ncbi:molybdopterin-synthase adenylyltransferase MoeB [Flexivirga meconopsidis]|uniref:molybdopterin-synthase adenylyltransferase MoeB n=1 Tax=Flexivirga meconopsidis TaxID=2977121 RepID=UPI00223F04FA
MTRPAKLRAGTTPDRPDPRRYARHLLLPELGMPGQERLGQSRVIVVGAGGLAAPVLSYLAAAGVGRVTVVDDDAVDLSNLQRQVIHRTEDVGVSKVESAIRAVHDLNPDVEIVGVPERLTADNALTLFADHDVVVDATDNFATRYLVGDACVLLGLPLVWGSIHRFDGQVTVWSYDEGPCYRCVFPEAPPAGAVPSCAEAGVLGALPGVIGAMQATEAVKVLLGIGEPLAGRLMLYNALHATWSSVPVQRDPECAVCGAHPTITTLTDTVASCAPPVPDAADDVREVDALALADQVAGDHPPVVVDVRSEAERDIVRLPIGIHVPIETLRDGTGLGRLDAIDADTVFYCKGGTRSAEAVRLVRDATGVEARSLAGGILAWIDEVDPTLARY